MDTQNNPNAQAADGIEKRRAAAHAAVNDLLAGKTTPGNRYIGDLVEQMKQAHTDRNDVLARLEQGEGELRELRDRKLMLDGMLRNGVSMLMRWHTDQAKAGAGNGD